ncbi:unnamed protein product [Strongylus vulgaris]|uniref:Uncharacterized protein n=1 Tax=Strongylus vulgaris TaxID=40348 RepID=A0A3P7IHK5_STRVU|nr:unnamed protein product [Strongylus vulgaris]
MLFYKLTTSSGVYGICIGGLSAFLYITVHHQGVSQQLAIRIKKEEKEFSDQGRRRSPDRPGAEEDFYND